MGNVVETAGGFVVLQDSVYMYAVRDEKIKVSFYLHVCRENIYYCSKQLSNMRHKFSSVNV